MAVQYTAEDLMLHVSKLAFQHNVRLNIRRENSGHACRMVGQVLVPLIKSPVSYVIALHEIGHCVGEYPPDLLDKEAAAWEWAKANALFWNASMQDFMEFCLMTYLRDAGVGNVRVDALLNPERR